MLHIRFIMASHHAVISHEQLSDEGFLHFCEHFIPDEVEYGSILECYSHPQWNVFSVASLTLLQKED